MQQDNIQSQVLKDQMDIRSVDKHQYMAESKENFTGEDSADDATKEDSGRKDDQDESPGNNLHNMRRLSQEPVSRASPL